MYIFLAQVHFILSGEYEETDVRPLSDPKRKILRRGATDGFLLAVPRYILAGSHKIKIEPPNFLLIYFIVIFFDQVKCVENFGYHSDLF